MPTAVLMPSFGMYAVEGAVAAWLVSPGGAVAAGQPIVEITTGEASFELEAPAAGVFAPVVELGTMLPVEGLIAWILAPGEVAPAGLAAVSASSAADEAAGPAADAAAGAAGTPGAVPAQTATDAATSAGEEEPTRILARRAPTLPPAAAGGEGASEGALEGGGGASTPLADGVAAAPSGPVEAPADGAGEAGRDSAPGDPAAVPWRVRERVPWTGLRRAIAERLRRVQSTAVAMTLTREVEVADLVAAQAELAAGCGGDLPWDAVFVAAFGRALRDRPELLAIVAGEEILLLDEVHVGFAVSLAGALVVPVVRDADRRSLPEIAAHVRALAVRARTGRLAPTDVLGGTATVTNLGSYGVDAFTPVLDPPQSAILGVGRIAPRAVAVGGALAVRPTCTLSLTFDHRVADGALAALLLAAVADRLADPRSL